MAALDLITKFDKHKAVAAHKKGQASFSLINNPILQHHTFRSSFVMEAGPSVPMQGLRPISFAELEVDTVHRGCVLFGILCVDGFMITAIMSVLEDAENPRLAMPLTIYNAVPSQSSVEHVQKLFPKGTRVAIKEPYVKTALDGRIVVRVDNPANVEKLDSKSEQNLKSEELRQQGNAYFANQDFISAIDCYTKCIDCLKGKGETATVKSSLVLAYSNRAEAWIRLLEYRKALLDAKSALGLDSSHVKSMLRKARALHGLMKYEDAVVCLEELLGRNPGLEDAVTLLETVKRCLTSQERLPGLSDYILGKGQPPKFADFIGPVEIRKTSDGRGRGLFSTKDLSPGELLVVSNAVASCQTDCKLFAMDFNSNIVNSASQEDLVTELVRISMKYSGLLSKLNRLQAAPSQKFMDVPPMDIFTSGAEESNISSVPLNVTQIRQIVRFNSLENNVNAATGGKSNAGLWYLPSFINHSCIPNASRLHIENTMIVCASSSIKPGEEITISYFNPFVPLVIRGEACKMWDFTCNCKRCITERGQKDWLENIGSQFKILFTKGKEKASASTNRKKNSNELSSIYSDLSILYKALKKKLKTRENLGDLERKFILAAYSFCYLPKWFTSWEKGENTGVDDSAVELADAMQTCMPGNFHTLCMLTRLGSAARRLGHASCDMLMEKARREYSSLFGNQNPDVVEKHLRNVPKICPIFFE